MRAIAMFLAVLLAGCGQKTGPTSSIREGDEPRVAVGNKPTEANANAAGDVTVAPANEVSSAKVGTLPPANTPLRFVGRWAATQAECDSKAWRFTADELTVPGGPRCNFYKVSKAPGGYDVAAQCPTKEPVHPDLLRLRFAESARAMLVESNGIPPTGLVYCGQ